MLLCRLPYPKVTTEARREDFLQSTSLWLYCCSREIST